MLETQLHHQRLVQLLNSTSTLSQNHSIIKGLLPRNTLIGKIKHFSSNFPLVTNFLNCWLACLLSGHSIFLLPIPTSLSLMKNSSKNIRCRCFQSRAQTSFSTSPRFSPLAPEPVGDLATSDKCCEAQNPQHRTPPEFLLLFIEVNTSHIWFPLILSYRDCPFTFRTKG